MNYKKERNFIVAYDGTEYRGKWDIIKNEYYGLKGTKVKTKPASFTYANTETGEFAFLFEMLRYNCDNGSPYTEKRGHQIESLISVGLTISRDWRVWELLETTTIKIDKNFIKYFQDNCSGCFSERGYKNYMILKEYQPLIDKCDNSASEWINNVLHYVVETNLPKDYVEGMIVRACHEKLYDAYRYYDFYELMINWYSYLTGMGEKVEIPHNILTNYYILLWRYRQYRDKHMDELIQANNDKAWLYYENDEYIVRPLLTKAEFHNEGEAQNNCVERIYMQKVVNGETHVVTIRKKSAPNDSYITCEVSNSKHIIQYLARFNRRPSDANDIDFYCEYALYLSSTPLSE